MHYEISVHTDVSDIKCISGHVIPAKEKSRGDRKKCKGMSKRSQLNLLKILQRLESVPDTFFITLTYRKTPTITQSKKHLHVLLDGLRKSYKKSATVWRMEFQENGNQHFHLIFYAGDPIQESELQNDIRERWSKILGDNNRNFLQNSTKTDRCYDVKGSKFYISGHHIKQNQTGKHQYAGRTWGIYGRRYLPRSEPKRVELQPDQVVRLKRICRSLFWARIRYSKGNISKRRARNSIFYRKLSYPESGSFTQFLSYLAMTKALTYLGGPAFSPISQGSTNSVGGSPYFPITSTLDLSHV